MKKVVFIVLFFSLILGAYWSYDTSIDDESVENDIGPMMSKFAAVAKGRIDIEGGVINLAAQRDGIIQEVLVEEGERVQKNQILAIQDTRQAQIIVSIAKAEYEKSLADLKLLQTQYESAQRDEKRSRLVAKNGAISTQLVDDAQTKVSSLEAQISAAKANICVAKARLEQAEFEIEVRNIRAPFDGRIIKRTAQPGSGLSTLNVTELFQLAPDKPRIVRVDVDEQFIDDVEVGMMASIVSETDPNKQWSGYVLRIGERFGSRKIGNDPTARQDVRVVDTVVSIDDNDVRLGQRVLVKIEKN